MVYAQTRIVPRKWDTQYSLELCYTNRSPNPGQKTRPSIYKETRPSIYKETKPSIYKKKRTYLKNWKPGKETCGNGNYSKIRNHEDYNSVKII